MPTTKLPEPGLLICPYSSDVELVTGQQHIRETKTEVRIFERETSRFRTITFPARVSLTDQDGEARSRMAMLDLKQTGPTDWPMAASLIDREIGDLIRAHTQIEQRAILLEGRRPADAASFADIEIVAPAVIERQQIPAQRSQRNHFPHQRFDR